MRFTIIGAGHGGQAMAGYLASQGYSTTLYNRTASVLEGIKRNNGIELRGYVNTKTQNIYLTNDLGEAMSKVDVVMVCVPANAHENIALNIAPYVKERHFIVLNPGRTLGAYYFGKYLKKYNCHSEVNIAETDTFILTSRKIEDGCSEIRTLKKVVYIGSARKSNTESICQLLSEAFPMVRAASSDAYTSLSNIGCIFHPLPAIFNIGRIENRDKYLHYKEGITPKICKLMEKLDDERLSLARALKVEIPSARTWLENVYASNGEGLYETLQNTTAYDEVFAPVEISTRYIYEDITTGIVPMYCMSQKVGTPNNILKLVLDIATQMLEYDFYAQGRTDVSEFLERIGKR